jgi:hypothetical protein
MPIARQASRTRLAFGASGERDFLSITFGSTGAILTTSVRHGPLLSERKRASQNMQLCEITPQSRRVFS